MRTSSRAAICPRDIGEPSFYGSAWPFSRLVLDYTPDGEACHSRATMVFARATPELPHAISAIKPAWRESPCIMPLSPRSRRAVSNGIIRSSVIARRLLPDRLNRRGRDRRVASHQRLTIALLDRSESPSRSFLIGHEAQLSIAGVIQALGRRDRLRSPRRTVAVYARTRNIEFSPLIPIPIGVFDSPARQTVTRPAGRLLGREV